MEVKVRILAKKSDNKAFKASDENWYNLNDNVISDLAKLNKGDEIVATYEKKGVSRYVSKLVKAGTEVVTETKESTTGFACEVCGKELKDGKFKKCFMCNKNKTVKKEEPKPDLPEPKKPFTPFDNPEKTEQIRRGNALNASAAIASGCGFNDPDTAVQFTLEVAERLLSWLKNE